MVRCSIFFKNTTDRSILLFEAPRKSFFFTWSNVEERGRGGWERGYGARNEGITVKCFPKLSCQMNFAKFLYKLSMHDTWENIESGFFEITLR